LCSDFKIRKLNAEYRGKDRITDVLSFPFKEKDLLGEIYISLQRADVQARRFAISYEGEIERLFLHGLFHLHGYDHTNAKNRRTMEAKENLYWCSISRLQ
jgi:probable rRNA maturation factor